MTPIEIIQRAKDKAENDLREACAKTISAVCAEFSAVTGAAVSRVSFGFVDCICFGGPMETSLINCKISIHSDGIL